MVKRLSISQKITYGFLVNTILLGGLALFSLFEVNKLAGMFIDYRGTARQTIAIAEFSAEVGDTRRAAMTYRLAPNPAAVAAVDESVEDIRTALSLAEEVFAAEPERLKALQALAAQVTEYSGAFAQMVALQQQRNVLVDAIADAGRTARSKLSEIMASAEADGDAAAAVRAGETQQHLMLARLYAERFLLDNAPGNADRVAAEFGQSAAILAELDQELQNPVRRRLLAETVALKEAFKKNFAAVKNVILERNAIRRDRLDRIGPEVQAALAALTGEIVERQNRLGPAAQDSMAATMTVVAVVGAGAFAFGLILALVLPRTLAGLAGLTKAIAAIERQEENVDVPGKGRSDEVGAIAKALSAISASGAQAARVTAAVKASATPIAITNRDHDIVFQNTAFRTLANENQAAFDTLAPDVFGLRNAEGVLNAVETAKAADSSRTQPDGATLYQISAEGRIFGVRTGAVEDASGQSIGATIEITDITTTCALEKEVVDVIDAVERGDLSQRVISIDNLGFTSFVASGMNRVIDTVSAFMQALDQSVSAMAKGDLTQTIDAPFDGDFDVAKNNINANLARFNSAIAQIAATVGTVDAASGQISQSAQQGAEGAESQASALEETAATIEEMSATIKNSAGAADQAAQLAADAQTRANNGRQVVVDAVTAMGEIEDGSDKIADIISVIDGISFQTNLLALNAAVEAARAGEAGKGFAVVAAEVRALAQRAAGAASDIKQLIDESSGKVEQGVALVNQTGAALEEIDDAVTQLSSMIGDISRSAREQASGVEGINAAIGSLDAQTQRNAAVADQSATQAKQLNEQAQTLSRLAASFETGAATPAAAAEPEPEPEQEQEQEQEAA